jgi:hypothetical protein
VRVQSARRSFAPFITLWLVGSSGCAALPPSRSAPTPPLSSLGDEWHEAQLDIAALEPAAPGDPFRVSPGSFVIETEKEPFFCADTGIHAVLRVYGCFRAEPENDKLGVIRYVPGRKALRHEARHAILFALGDGRWAEVGH